MNTEKLDDSSCEHKKDLSGGGPLCEFRKEVSMISLDRLRKIDPDTDHLTDDELEKVRQSFYDFGQLIFEDWQEQKFGSKNPVGLLTAGQEEHTM